MLSGRDRDQPFLPQFAKAESQYSSPAHKRAVPSGGRCCWSGEQGRGRGPFRNAVPGDFSLPACKIPNVWDKPQDIVQQRRFGLYSSEIELEKGFIFKTLVPAGGGGGGRHWEELRLDQEGGILLEVGILLHFLLLHILFSIPSRIVTKKFQRHELRSQWFLTSILLLLYFSSEGFPLGRILNVNNGSKAEKQTVHYWKECQESWEADLTPTGVLHLIVMASFIVTGGLDHCFFSFSSSFSNCWDKSKPTRIKNSQTGQEYLGQEIRSSLVIQWTELTLLFKKSIRK